MANKMIKLTEVLDCIERDMQNKILASIRASARARRIRLLVNSALIVSAFAIVLLAMFMVFI